MLLELTTMPFSTYGSYLVLSKYADGLYLRDIRGGDSSLGKLIRFECYVNDVLVNINSFHYEGTETFLSFSYQNASLFIAFENEDVIRFKGENLKLKLLYHIGSYDHLNIVDDKTAEFHSYSEEVKLKTFFVQGTYEKGIAWQGERTLNADITTSELFDMAFESYRDVSKHHQFKEFNDVIKQSLIKYKEWKNSMLTPFVNYESSFAKASYITYASMVKPEGLLKRYSMYMSINWMTNIWSWDNCFNALGLAKNHPELSFDQFITFKDMQLESGVLPDFANNLFCSYSCTKPPVQGWTYSLLQKMNPYFSRPEIMREAYDMMANQISYWETYRTDEGYGLPYYNHGNDSGMDNATVFMNTATIISPDLASYMILQYETLHNLANLLKKTHTDWLVKASQLQEKLLSNLYDGKNFYSVDKYTKKRITKEHALINLLPIIIGHRLDKEIVSNITRRLLSKDFYTQYGFATEAVSSEYYNPNGYWRGPIWAPTTLLIIDGLRRSGFKQEAITASQKYCEMTLIGGMAENFDSLTAQGLVDPAFTWTSNVFFVLAHYYLNEKSEIYEE